jgi:hypothetical protein
VRWLRSAVTSAAARHRAKLVDGRARRRRADQCGWRIPKEGLLRDKGTILELALGLVVFTVVGVGKTRLQARFVGSGNRFRRSPAATRLTLGLTVPFGPMLLGAVAAAGTNLAAHRCSNFLWR